MNVVKTLMLMKLKMLVENTVQFKSVTKKDVLKVLVLNVLQNVKLVKENLTNVKLALKVEVQLQNVLVQMVNLLMMIMFAKNVLLNVKLVHL